MAITRLGLGGGSRTPYGDFSGKIPSAVQLSGSTGWNFGISGDISASITVSLSGSTGFDWEASGALNVHATLSGGTGYNWGVTGNLVDLSAPDEDISFGAGDDQLQEEDELLMAVIKDFVRRAA